CRPAAGRGGARWPLPSVPSPPGPDSPSHPPARPSGRRPSAPPGATSANRSSLDPSFRRRQIPILRLVRHGDITSVDAVLGGDDARSRTAFQDVEVGGTDELSLAARRHEPHLHP